MSNAEALRNLTQDMARAQVQRNVAQRERTRRIAEIKKDMSDLLKGFGKSRSEISAQLKSELAKLKSELAKSKGEIKKDTSDLLKGFKKSRSETRTQLKSDLAKLKLQLAEKEEERKSEVKNLLEGFGKDSAETAAAWRELVATMESKRGVAVAPPPPKATIVKEEEVPIEDIVPEEKARLENRILDLIRGQPEGMRLTAIAEAVGEARIKVGNVTRMLVDERKIKKEGLLYFPA